MARSTAKSGEIAGVRWALGLMLLLLVGLAAASWMTRADFAKRAQLDTIAKSPLPLPTPAPKSEADEEMDPEKEGN